MAQLGSTLNNVLISAPLQDGDTLVYDLAKSVWVNDPGGGSSDVVTDGTLQGNGTSEDPLGLVDQTSSGSYVWADITVNGVGIVTAAATGNPMTTAADIVVGGASGTPTRLGIGTANQVLSVNGGATALVWANAASTSVDTDSSLQGDGTSGDVLGLAAQTSAGTYVWADITVNSVGVVTVGAKGNPMTTAGDMVVATTGGSPVRLGLGTSNQVLTVNSAGTAVAWATDPFYPNPMTTAGDMVVGGVSGLPTRLAAGISGMRIMAMGTAATTATSELWIGDNFGVSNIGFTATAAASALTVALTDNLGASLSATSPGIIRFQDATVTNGFPSRIFIQTSALTVVIPSGTTIGTTNSYAGWIYVYLVNTGGTLSLGVSLSPFSLQAGAVSTVAISGGASPTTIYTTAAHSNVALQYLGKFLAPQTVAGTWAASATQIFNVLAQDYAAGTLLSQPGDLETIISNVPARLAMGTANQVLAVNSGGTALQWASANTTVTTDTSLQGTGSNSSPLGLASQTSAGTYVWSDITVNSVGIVTVAATGNPMTSTADMITATAGGAPARLSKGSSHQILTMDSAGTAQSWATDAYYPNPMTTAGDILVGASAGAPTRLAQGTANQVLTVNSGATGVQWSTDPFYPNPMTAQGQMIIGGASGVVTVLGVPPDVTDILYGSSTGVVGWQSAPRGGISVTVSGGTGDNNIYPSVGTAKAYSCAFEGLNVIGCQFGFTAGTNGIVNCTIGPWLSTSAAGASAGFAGIAYVVNSSGGSLIPVAVSIGSSSATIAVATLAGTPITTGTYRMFISGVYD